MFRKDINGLRAIAVIAVVLFHFSESWLPGGFAGVDVFFVISGFLMTGIIFRGIEKNDFSILKFYVARANRIIPALAMLCLILLIFGWFFLTPLDYKILGKHVYSSIGFFSNNVYWSESGYFDAGSREKWLLHTWSLSLEWQFYIIYPLVLVAMRRFMSVKSMKLAVLIGAVLGFIFCVIATYKWPNHVYYLLPTRVWEMMIGGVAYVYPFSIQGKKRKFLGWFSYILIIGSYFLISKDNPWPGYLALFPVFGAFLLIQTQRNDSFIISNIVSQKIGTWSYSIYLWHWPLVVYFWGNNGGNGSPIGYIVLSILLGFLSYNLIEKVKFKTVSVVNVFSLFNFKPIHHMLLIGTAAIFVSSSGGVDSTYRKQANSSEALYEKAILELRNQSIKEFKEECNYFDRYSGSSKINISESCVNNGIGGIFLWGDSHAQALSYGLRQTFPDVVFNQVASSACRPMLKKVTNITGGYKVACDRSNERAKHEILNIKPQVIILAQRLGHDENDYLEIKRFLDVNKLQSSILIIGPVPQWKPSLPKVILNRHFNPEIKYLHDASLVKETLSINNTLKLKYSDSKLHYISIIDSLCEQDKCLAKTDDFNTPLVFDDGHLSLHGSQYVVKKILKKEIQKYLILNTELVI